MKLSWLDVTVALSFLLFPLVTTAWGARGSPAGPKGFFLAGRKLPWYLAGSSLTAIMFMAGTPNQVTALVAHNGISGNWSWWWLAPGGLLTTFFFARLWRRAGTVTDVEFVEIRYSGRPAAFLRGFKAIVFGPLVTVPFLAMALDVLAGVFQVLLPRWSPFPLVAMVVALTALYTAFSGLAGTALTEALQFLAAMVGCAVVAAFVVSLPEIGGPGNLGNLLSPETLRFVPHIGDLTEGIDPGRILVIGGASLLFAVGLQSWTFWFIGMEAGGGGYAAQRMLAAQDERHSLLVGLWSVVAHNVVRPWPWILVALAALVVMPRVDDVESLRQGHPGLYERVEAAYQDRTLLRSEDPAFQTERFRALFDTYENSIEPRLMYPKMALRSAPAGLHGLVIGIYLCAIMSTLSALLNWASSYFVNDLYRRFLDRSAPDSRLVWVSRLTILAMAGCSLLLLGVSVDAAFSIMGFLFGALSGIGPVLLARWYWWRVNAWSEIVAIAASVTLWCLLGRAGLDYQLALVFSVLGTTASWLAVTFLTRPVEQGRLVEFYQRVHPSRLGWSAYSKEGPEGPVEPVRYLVLGFFASMTLVYSLLFALGGLLLGEHATGALLLCVGALSAVATGWCVFRSTPARH